MDEEIIIPEEETFDYKKLRYILNKDGYLCHCSIGGFILCDLGECTEYNGEIPDGYETLEQWYDTQINEKKLNAWKVVDGNFIFDENKYKDLQAIWKIEEEENALATHKYVKDKLKVSSSVITDEIASGKTGSSLLVLYDAGNYEIPELKIESVAAQSVNVISSNKNILGIDAISETINGLEITINKDGTIKLNGTSTDSIEFDLNGSTTNTEMKYLIKENMNYAMSGLTENVSLSLYSFDGTDRALVYSDSNSIFNLSNSNNITQTTLNIPSGITFEDVVISPQIELDNATSFIKHEETKSFAILNDNECYIDGLMSYEDKTIIMIDADVTSSIKYYRHQYLNEKFAEIEVNEKEVKSTVLEMNETIDQQNTKISQISQTVSEIKSEISDIADITISADGYGSVYLEKINESEPIYIKIYPSENEDISFLYPRDNLYPSDDLILKGRTLRFENDEYIVDYELPNDLLYYDENIYDEFILDYDNQKCEVNKRVGCNEDGSKYILDVPKTISYEYPTIPLTTGDYTVTMLNYDNAYMFIRMMCENIYTTQFATKVELNSSISQTKDSITSQVSKEYATKNELVSTQSSIKQTTNSINLEVSKKVNNTDYTSANILMKINNDTSSTVIKADKVDIEGIATFTNNKLAKAGSTTINGSNITTGTLSANRINGGSITASTINLGSGKFKVTTAGALTSTSGTIGGWTIDGSSGIKSGSSSLLANGNLNLFPSAGGRYNINNGVRLNATSGVVISSNGGVTSNFPSANLDIKACSGATAYIGCMANADGTSEKSGVSCTNGILKFTSDGYCTYNGTTVFGSSSKATKENIVDLKDEQKEEVYELIKTIPTKQYDYKKQYGKPFNYGFIIEDIEDTKLKDLLHITQAENNEDIKMYSTEDLARLELITIQMLMNKIEKLEARIESLEREVDK